MKLKTVRLAKEFKVGLPNFSNLTSTCDLSWEVGENEEFDFEKAWDELNRQMYIQSSNIEPSWMQTQEYKNFFKIIVKTAKRGGESE